jgi:membrane-associated phospholipid phosphatase
VTAIAPGILPPQYVTRIVLAFAVVLLIALALRWLVLLKSRALYPSGVADTAATAVYLAFLGVWWRLRRRLATQTV